ncbi:hypothetical protein QAD02_007795 [Eretmocerus hayati]|uniref:Uncharacterized protein n=1 Tax=Eretmocerus hayati TaxID=131215 RepID=A0ACC2N5A9_9HYME|nr:hypothetical protein QAD02_007795 [Eretmocerus hayati]
MPLEITLKGRTVENTKRSRSIQIWNKEARETYKKEQEEWTKTGNWTNLKNRISRATTTRQIEEKDTDSRTWWDEGCWRKKKEVLELFQEVRGDKARGGGYYARRAEYRKLIEKKEREEGERQIEEMLKDKSE